jgi:hypothetical protein
MSRSSLSPRRFLRSTAFFMGHCVRSLLFRAGVLPLLEDIRKQLRLLDRPNHALTTSSPFQVLGTWQNLSLLSVQGQIQPILQDDLTHWRTIADGRYMYRLQKLLQALFGPEGLKLPFCSCVFQDYHEPILPSAMAQNQTIRFQGFIGETAQKLSPIYKFWRSEGAGSVMSFNNFDDYRRWRELQDASHINPTYHLHCRMIKTPKDILNFVKTDLLPNASLCHLFVQEPGISLSQDDRASSLAALQRVLMERSISLFFFQYETRKFVSLYEMDAGGDMDFMLAAPFTAYGLAVLESSAGLTRL